MVTVWIHQSHRADIVYLGQSSNKQNFDKWKINDVCEQLNFVLGLRSKWIVYHRFTVKSQFSFISQLLHFWHVMKQWWPLYVFLYSYACLYISGKYGYGQQSPHYEQCLLGRIITQIPELYIPWRGLSSGRWSQYVLVHHPASAYECCYWRDGIHVSPTYHCRSSPRCVRCCLEWLVVSHTRAVVCSKTIHDSLQRMSGKCLL